MKKIVALLLAGCFFALQACAVEQWSEGEHYVVISDKASEKPQVLEFFSFWCPHCYNFEPIVAQIKSKLDEGVEFQKVHVNFMGFTGPDIQNDATRAMMVARSLKKETQLNGAIFNYIHVQRSHITGLKDLKNIFIANGVSADEFDKLSSSFGVNSLLQKNNKLIGKFRKHVRGVPNFIVNGKYQAQFTRDMTPDDMVELIVWLSKQP